MVTKVESNIYVCFARETPIRCHNRFWNKIYKRSYVRENGTIYGIQLVKVHGGDITFKYWIKKHGRFHLHRAHEMRYDLTLENIIQLKLEYIFFGFSMHLKPTAFPEQPKCKYISVILRAHIYIVYLLYIVYIRIVNVG